MIESSVIGSYPVSINNKIIMNDYFDQKQISWNSYIKSAVDDMVSSGIDFISDGQTRDPFIQLFTRKLKGCRIRIRTEIIGKVSYVSPITVEDQKYVRAIIPKNKKLLGILTGPYTLANSCVDLFYNNLENLSIDFSEALHHEALELQKHVDLISIDEPFFSNSMPDYGKQLISKIVQDIKIPTRLHVCGNVAGIISELIKMPVDILSCEFKASPHLIEEFNKYNFNQNLCFGSVRSDDTKVESVDEIVNHINKGLDYFGDKIVQIAPDCGQRLLPRDIAYQKLINLVKAGKIINGR